MAGSPTPTSVAVTEQFSPLSVVAEGGNSVATDELRTIFITGLPEDVKERELQNLLRWLPGYEASQVNFKGEHPMGFALFSSYHFAFAAKDALQDMVFDAELNSVIHTEMAKKNLFVKRVCLTAIVGDPNDQSKRMRVGSGDYVQTVYSTPFHHPSVWGGAQGYLTAAPAYAPYAAYPVPPLAITAGPPLHVQATSSYAAMQNTKDNPPCNTLFIGNLGEYVNEEELKGIFSAQLGYRQMKILRQERHTVCFIEFEDLNSAMDVHQNLQGAVLPSSGAVGMRIQYSKNPFGKRKDGIVHVGGLINGSPQHQISLSYQ